YRQTGNLVEAGRWAYLTEDLRAEELAAFERAHRSAWVRLRLMRWTADPDEVPAEAGRQRLQALIAQAERQGPPDPYRVQPEAEERGVVIPCLFVLVVTLAFGTLGAIGFYRVVNWIMH